MTDAVDPTVLVVAPIGEIDMETVVPLRVEVLGALEEGVDHIVVDCEHLTFMDSTGIALLVEVARRGVSVSLRHVPPAVRRILDLTGMASVVVVES